MLHYVILCFFGSVLLVTFVFFGKAIQYGRRLRRNRYSQVTLASHKKYVDLFIVSTACAVLLIEILVKLENGGWGEPVLFSAHFISIAVFMVSFLLMRFIWTGIIFWEYHRRLFVIVLASFATTSLTGIALMYELFQKYGIV